MKIGCIGDMHFRERLPYSEYIPDERKGEWYETLDFIVDSFKDCSHIVFMGDQFDRKNNTSEVNRSFVEFLEQFGPDKHIYLIAGNHEKSPNGSSALDFIKEIKGKHWYVINKPTIEKIGDISVGFLPYMYMNEMNVNNIKDLTSKIMSSLTTENIPSMKLLFAHHAISGTSVFSKSVETMLTSEPVLSREELKTITDYVIAGHIHEYQESNPIAIVGSSFSSEVGEHEKFIIKLELPVPWGVDLQAIKLPVRGIYGFTDPNVETLSAVPKSSIVKVTITDPERSIEDLKVHLSRFDGSVIVAKYPSKREKEKASGLSDDIVRNTNMEYLLQLFCNGQESPEKIDIPGVIKVYKDLIKQ